MLSGCGELARSSWLFKLAWPGPGGAFRTASVTKGRRHLRPQFGEAVGGGLRSLGAEAPVRVRRSAVHGYGLYAARELEAGTFVVEYRGQVIRTVLEDVREQACAPRAAPPSASRAPPHFLPPRASRPPAAPAPYHHHLALPCRSTGPTSSVRHLQVYQQSLCSYRTDFWMTILTVQTSSVAAIRIFACSGRLPSLALILKGPGSRPLAYPRC